MEAQWEDPERDAAVARKFNLWSAGCRDTEARHETPTIMLSMQDVLTRLTTTNQRHWGTFSHAQTELMNVARRTLFELRAAAATRPARS